MIKPTVGRVVWGWNLRGYRYDDVQPFDAHITYVWNDHMVNIAYEDHSGQPLSQTSVKLKQDGDGFREGLPDSHTGGEPYVTWMPYQVGQAKVHEPRPAA